MGLFDGKKIRGRKSRDTISLNISTRLNFKTLQLKAYKLIGFPKGIVSRDFVVCFLVSFDRSDISTHQEWVLLLL
jgi:hypothetical protein